MSSVDIYTILSSKQHNPHYLKRYYTFIQGCLESNSKKTKEELGRVEQHHICPKATDLFPEYTSFKKDTWNKACLTLDQHFIAHHMLWKAYGGSQTIAFHKMQYIPESLGRGIVNRKINRKTSVLLKQEHSERQSKYYRENNPSKLPHVKELRREHMRIMSTRRWADPEFRARQIGRIVSEESRKKMSDSHMGHKASDNQKKAVSASNKRRELEGKSTIHHAINSVKLKCFAGGLIFESVTAACIYYRPIIGHGIGKWFGHPNKLDFYVIGGPKDPNVRNIIDL